MDLTQCVREKLNRLLAPVFWGLEMCEARGPVISDLVHLSMRCIESIGEESVWEFYD